MYHLFLFFSSKKILNLLTCASFITKLVYINKIEKIKEA